MAAAPDPDEVDTQELLLRRIGYTMFNALRAGVTTDQLGAALEAAVQAHDRFEEQRRGHLRLVR